MLDRDTVQDDHGRARVADATFVALHRAHLITADLQLHPAVKFNARSVRDVGRTDNGHVQVVLYLD